MYHACSLHGSFLSNWFFDNINVRCFSIQARAGNKMLSPEDCTSLIEAFTVEQIEEHVKSLDTGMHATQDRIQVRGCVVLFHMLNGKFVGFARHQSMRCRVILCGGARAMVITAGGSWNRASKASRVAIRLGVQRAS